MLHAVENREARRPAPRQEFASTVLGTLRILIIDDSAEDRELYRRFLRQDPHHTYQVVEAETGESGLALYKSNQPDCILLDYLLPDLDGLDLLRLLRREAIAEEQASMRVGEEGGPVLTTDGAPGRAITRVPVIVLTGHGSDTVDLRAMEEGAEDYLVKGDITPTQLILSVRHAIERHRLLAALRDHELRLEAILVTAPDGIITFGDDGRIESFNVTAESLFRYEARQIIGKGIDVLVPGLRPLDVGATHGEYNACRSDGRPFPIEVTISRAALSRQGHFYTAIVRDITERRWVERAERAAREAAEVASAARRDFVATASHDLRTPLHIMIGFLDMALDVCRQCPQCSLIQDARGAATSLNTLISDLLDFSKIDAGKVDIQPRRFELRAHLDQIVNLFAPKVQEKHLRLRCEIDPDVPHTLIGDPNRLQQILTNLIANAIKFTDSGEIAVDALLGEVVNNRVLIRFEVKDTGIGLAPGLHGHLFQPFTQGDGEHYSGTGLGLSICKRLIELMGGEIGVESTRGRGSTFWFTMPMERDGPKFSWP